MRKAGVKKSIDLVVWALENKMIRQIKITEIVNKKLFFCVYEDGILVYANDLDISDHAGIDYAKRYLIDVVKVLCRS